MKKALLLMITLSTVALGASLNVHAEESEGKPKEEQTTKSTSEATVQPMVSDNQVGNISSYYYMKWTPGGEDTIGVRITNSTDKDKIYEIKNNKAMTNPNGVMVYDQNTMNDTGTTPRVNELLDMPTEVTVKANSSEDVFTTIKYGATDFNGFKIGGIHVSEKTAPNKDKQFNQKLAYALPVLIEGNLGRSPKMEFTFGDFGFERIGTGIYSIVTPFNNPTANWMQNAKTSIEVKNSEGEIVLEENRAADIAPEGEVQYNSMFNDDLPAGVYEVTLTVSSDLGQWTENQKVELTKKQAADIAETVNIGDKREPSIFENIYFDVLLVMIAAIVGYVGGKLSSRKRKDEITEGE